MFDKKVIVKVVAPSDTVSVQDKEKLYIVKELFENKLPVHVVFSEMIFDESIVTKLDDLMSSFSDDFVDIVYCWKWWFCVNSLLRYIDFDTIRRNPKPIFWFSDNTILINAIYAKTGLSTFHAPNFINYRFMDEEVRDRTLQDVRCCMVWLLPTFLTQSSSFCYEQWWSYNISKWLSVISQGFAKGDSIWWNICSFSLLQWTEYLPEGKDYILFLEDDDLCKDFSLLELNRNIESLFCTTIAPYVKGIVFGRFQIGSNIQIQDIVNLIVLKPYLGTLPIVANFDFGHTFPNYPFKIGGKCILDTSKLPCLSFC